MSFLRTILSTIYRILVHGRPDYILSFGHSLGDNLLLTTLAAELHRRGHQNIWIKCDHVKLFEENAHVRLVMPYNTLLSTKLLKALRVKMAAPAYTEYCAETDRDAIPEKHIVLKMADCIGLKGDIFNKPVLNLSQAEILAGKQGEGHIIVVTATRGATVPITNKEWQQQSYQEVVNALYQRIPVIQLGSPNDPLLNNVADLRGKTTLRESAAILTNARLLVTHVGFMMHLARAVNCKAVIIYGGREMPAQSGYLSFKNIYHAVPCSPCWLHNTCSFGKKCMEGISPAMVLEAALSELEFPAPPADETLHND